MTDERKTIFITGAASGIGKATAELFAAKGWFVGLFDHNSKGLAKVQEGLPTGSCVTGHLDVRDREHWEESVNLFVGATGGRMDVFLNNAGIGEGGDFEDIPEDVQKRIIDINLIGVLNGLNATLPILKKSAPSKIINVASAAGIYGPPRLAVYGATKAAVLSLSESLEIELEGDGVGVSTIMPWFIDTPILDGSAHGSNKSTREALRDAGTKIYPVSMVTEAVWKAAHSKKQHHTVGREATIYRRLTGFFPSVTRRIYRKRYKDHGDAL